MKHIGALVFPKFELLDLCGPLQMFGLLKEDFSISLVASDKGPVPSNQQVEIIAKDSFIDNKGYDILFVPGGIGTRDQVFNPDLIDWLKHSAQKAEYVLSVCTGSSLLARTGVLDSFKATTNKAAFDWVRSQGPKVNWQAKARWVEDGKFFTSSGVTAGMDMALGFIAHLHGDAKAKEVAKWSEYQWHDDPNWDPFAAIHGLVKD